LFQLRALLQPRAPGSDADRDAVRRAIAPFAAKVVPSIAVLVAVAQFAAAIAGTGYWFDEVYMLAIGRSHLDWGSADQPPLTPALARLLDAIAPASIVALRTPAILAVAAAVVVAALIARELGGDRRAQVLTAGAQATGIWTTLAGHWLTPYTLEPVQWLTLLWLVIRWIRVRDDRLLLALGVVAGIAAMTKFQVLSLCVVLLVTVAVLGPRDLLRRPLLWVGAAVCALISAPTLAWQSAHGWPQLQMTKVVASEADALYGGRPGIAVELIIFAGVAGSVLMIYGLYRLLRAEEERQYRFFAATFIILYLVFVATEGRPYYLGGLYAPLAAAGAVGLQRRRESGKTRWRWVAWPAYALSTAVAIGMLVMGATITRSQVPEQIAQQTAATYHALPEPLRAHTVVMGESYILAAYIDGLSGKYDLPKAYSGNRSYGYFPPPLPDRDVVLYIGTNPDRIRPYFRDAVRVGEVQGDINAWLLTGRLEPWDTIYPRLRTLTVS
jgi:4-amino-4-deoxy-L-arabinose transferase-like glycosyltransferase